MNVRVALTLAIFVVSAAPALAQTDGKFAIGADFSVKVPGSPEANGRQDIGLLWRLGHGEEGWGYHWALGWYETDIERPVAQRTVELGELHVRPLMGGYGYTHKVRAFTATAAMFGGFSFNSIRLSAAAPDAYRDYLGARSVSADAGITPVLMPRFSVWYDLNRKIGLHTSIGYTFARPTVTVRSTAGEDKRRAHADMFAVKVGLAYSVF